jgi:hypothetical protein
MESCGNYDSDVACRRGNGANCHKYRNLSVRPNDHFQDDERFGWQSNHRNDGDEARLSADGIGLRSNDHFRDEARLGWQSNHGNDGHEAGLSADGPERLQSDGAITLQLASQISAAPFQTAPPTGRLRWLP